VEGDEFNASSEFNCKFNFGELVKTNGGEELVKCIDGSIVVKRANKVLNGLDKDCI
jgi:hypothetical protein